MERIDHSVDWELNAKDETIHSQWDNTLNSVLTVSSGDIVRFDCREGSNKQITNNSGKEEILDMDMSPVHPLTGPVAIEEAEPGDILEIELLEINHKGWGWTAFWPERGLLPGEFKEPGLYIWDLEETTGYFVNGIEVPLKPFPGTIGVAPAESGKHSTLPPRTVGGNIDSKQLIEGSTLYLPIRVEDALFSIGDGHAAQGDGEVCQTAIETPISITVRLTVHDDISIKSPVFSNIQPSPSSEESESIYCTTGIDNEVEVAMKKAVRNMICHLENERELHPKEAYILCSSIMDLNINVAVNPNYLISASIPQSIFPD